MKNKNFSYLILLDAPQLEIGIDTMCWVSKEFKGFKFIPLGLHVVSYSVVNQRGGSDGYVIVKKFIKEIEEFVTFAIESLEEAKEKLYAYDRFIAAYPMEQYDDWLALSTKIQFELQRVLPSLELSSFASESSLSKVAGLSSNEDVKFTQIDLKKSALEKTGVEKSKYSMDKSLLLKNITLDIGNDGLLGELQLSFLFLLYSHVFDGLEQWKLIIQLICECDEIIGQRPQFFIEFMQILRQQLLVCPKDLFHDIILRNNFLSHLLLYFLTTISLNYSNVPEVVKEAKKLARFVEQSFGWKLMAEVNRRVMLDTGGYEEGDDGPLVVDLQ